MTASDTFTLKLGIVSGTLTSLVQKVQAGQSIDPNELVQMQTHLETLTKFFSTHNVSLQRKKKTG